MKTMSNEKTTEEAHVVMVMQDNDSNWYWIPVDKHTQFTKACTAIEGLEYLEAPALFDTFSDAFGEYETGGDKDVKPETFGEANCIRIVMESTTDIIASASITFSPTNNLRFVEKSIPAEQGVLKLVRVLQQAHQGSDGSLVWEDVPLVIE